MIRVLFFGPVADRVKARELQLPFVAGMKLQEVVSELKTRYPEAFNIVCFTAVNQAQVNDMQLPLSDGDEVAFMAKFSGG
jgi:molybdopterin synthase sulfur carrier subunit